MKARKRSYTKYIRVPRIFIEGGFNVRNFATRKLDRAEILSRENSTIETIG